MTILAKSPTCGSSSAALALWASVPARQGRNSSCRWRQPPEPMPNKRQPRRGDTEQNRISPKQIADQIRPDASPTAIGTRLEKTRDHGVQLDCEWFLQPQLVVTG